MQAVNGPALKIALVQSARKVSGSGGDQGALIVARLCRIFYCLHLQLCGQPGC